MCHTISRSKPRTGSRGNIVLDVFGISARYFAGTGAEVAGGKDRVGGQVGEMLALDDVAHLVAGDVGLEEGLYSRMSAASSGFASATNLENSSSSSSSLDLNRGMRPNIFSESRAG